MDDTAKGNTTDDSELPFLIAQVSLYSADGRTAVDVGSPREHSSSPPQRLLYGNLVSSPHILLNLHGRQGVYFLFPDVSIRYQGRYLLSVTLLKLPGMGFGGPTEMSNEGMVLARAQTLPFDVLPRENYVAPVQTPLTQYFLQQGARMTTGSSGLRRC
ncbi:velvet factor [Abortiporus biennis]|nr:velvet factor [Abortiporus biennis]